MTLEAVLAPGARVVVRDEEWLVRSSVPVATGGYAVRVVGMSELVRNQERSFLTTVEEAFGGGIQEMRPEDTELVADNSPALRYVALTDGAELFRFQLPGPAGQLDATEDASRVLLSTLRGDLIDLLPGRFDADALVLSVPVASLREMPGQTEVSSRLLANDALMNG